MNYANIMNNLMLKIREIKKTTQSPCSHSVSRWCSVSATFTGALQVVLSLFQIGFLSGFCRALRGGISPLSFGDRSVTLLSSFGEVSVLKHR